MTSAAFSGGRCLSRCLLLALGVAVSVFVRADSPTYPVWWLDRGVVSSQPPAGPGYPGYNQSTYDAWMADNYNVALLGQAKNMAQAAKNTMELGEPSSAGSTVGGLVGAFSTAPENNYVPLSLGQLKAIAKPFYDRMHALGFPIVLGDGTAVAYNQYPWNPSTPVSENYKTANLGQLKYVFSFSLVGWPPMITDDDLDGLPDWWEIVKFGSITSQSGAGDADGDGLSNLAEFLAGTNPNSAAAVVASAVLFLDIYSP